MADIIKRETIENVIKYSESLRNLSASSKAASEAQRKLNQRIEEASRVSKKYNNLVEEATKQENVYKSALAKVRQEAVKGEKAKKKHQQAELKANKELSESAKKTAKYYAEAYSETRLREFAKQAEQTRKSLDKLVDLSDLKTFQKNLASAFSGKGLSRNFEQLVSNYKGMLQETLRISGSLSGEILPMPTTAEIERDLFKQYAESFKNNMQDSSDVVMDHLIEEFKRAGNEMEEARILEKALNVEGAVKNLEQMKRFGGKASFFTGAGGAAGGAGRALFKGDQATFSAQAKKMQDWSTAAKSSGKMMGFLGKGLGSLATGLQALGKLNWIFALITAIGKMISVFNKLDKYAKGLNQEFLRMAGPAGALEDASGSMKEFNDAIHALDRNLSLALLPKEIQSFFSAVSGSGVSLQGIMQTVGNYGRVIEQARKSSLEFGVSMEEMGQMIGTQMLELRSSLDDISDAFQKISYDASMAGVSSNKFYNAIESAALSLEFYGNNLQFVSGVLTEFIKTGNMGFKGATQLTDAVTELFKNMGMTERMQFISIAGMEEVRSAFEDLGKDYQNRLESINSEMDILNSKSGSLNEKEKARLEELKGQQKQVENLRDRYKEIAATGDLVQMATMLPGLAAETPRLMLDYLGGLGMDVFNVQDLPAVMKVLTDRLGLSAEQATQFVEEMNTLRRSFQKLDDKTLSASQALVRNNEGLRSLLESYKTNQVAFSEIEPELFRELYTTTRKFYKNEEEAAKVTEDLIAAIRNAPEVLLNPEMAAGRLAEISFRARGTRRAGIADLREKEMEELIEQTTPLSKLLEITQESMKYELTDNQLFRSMDQGIYKMLGVLKFMAKLFGGDYEKDQAKKQEKWMKKYANEFIIAQKDAAQLAEEIASDKASLANLAQRRERGELIPFGQEEALKKDLAEKQERLGFIKSRITDLEGMSADRRRTAQIGVEYQRSLLKARKDRTYSAEVGALTKGVQSELAGVASLKAQQDFMAMSEGFVKVKSGDIVVDSGSLSKGIGGSAGLYSGHVLSKSNMGGMGGSQHNWGGINIVFQAPADSTNPNAYRRMFVDAVEQIVDRKMYAEKQRIS
jgi:hypothetical protein